MDTNGSTTKACRTCGEVKPLDDFYRDPRMADGHVNRCKGCARTAALRYRAERSEEIRAYDRLRAKLPKRKRASARYKRAATKRGKHAARLAISYAVARGRLARPDHCSECGAIGRVQAHHPNHRRRLVVVWLCARCHNAVHRFIKKGMADSTAPTAATSTP